MRSELLNLEYWLEYCKEIIGTELDLGRSVKEYGGKHESLKMLYSGSNVLLTNGSEDPW